jgi:hypothetical protein
VAVTTTITVTKAPPPGGPTDVTDAYTTSVRKRGMSTEQLDQIAQVALSGTQLTVLTTMKRPWGGWSCEWEPKRINGSSVRVINILYQDYTVFRLCVV